MIKENLENAAKLLFTSDVQVVFTNDLNSFTLLEAEESLINNSSSLKRINEFKLGRKASREALQRFNLKGHPLAILRGLKGEPLFPEGFAGSISHSNNWGGSAVIKTKSKTKPAALGLDFQFKKKESSETSNALDRVLTDSEKSLIKKEEDKIDPFLQKLIIFSAKEAIYKALSPASIFKKELNWKSVSLTPVNHTPDKDEENKIIELLPEFNEEFLEDSKKILSLKIKSLFKENYIFSAAEAEIN